MSNVHVFTYAKGVARWSQEDYGGGGGGVQKGFREMGVNEPLKPLFVFVGPHSVIRLRNAVHPSVFPSPL